MLGGVLEIASYCSLGVVVVLLVLRLLWPQLGPRLHALRFRRRLGSAERVLATWADELKAEDEGRHHEQRHPETTEDS